MLVAVGNGPSYGGGMRVTPDAAFDDGLLDVLVLHRIPVHEFLRIFPKLFTGAHTGHPAVQIRPGPRGAPRGAAASWPTPTASGSLRCRSTVEVVPGALSVLA